MLNAERAKESEDLIVVGGLAPAQPQQEAGEQANKHEACGVCVCERMAARLCKLQCGRVLRTSNDLGWEGSGGKQAWGRDELV